ncbi:Eukaryotic translation initiation factor 2D [Psilocybe cubensis]|uniref:Eukaryotic translation initiation factor 2D n=2 Tax=Psilocybe cubensis TaxID=181762 RepID=A0ACB8GQ36_PSICU|nr:Eukaryotic translation initiation factor 2D [Psilocybe cubensis]KAH9477154.1 Eukaryotic translation initiation factor 2D [Psilocybe cubensis]
MFKKPLSNLKTSAPLRSSDRRKLKQRAITSYSLTPEEGDVLVPDGILSVKFSTHVDEPGVAYLSSDGDPLWFTIGKGTELDLIPTIYTLWKKQDLLPYLSTPSAVTPILIGGADLMIPGVIHCPPALPPQQLVAIRQFIRKDGQPFISPPVAVGWMALPSDQLRTAAKEKGKAVHIAHTWKDHLWDMGSKSDIPDDTTISTGPGEETAGDSSDGENEDEGKSSATPPPHSDGPVSPSPEPSVTYSAAEVTELLDKSLLQAIKTSLPGSSFPIPATQFYSNYILPSRPAFPTLIVSPAGYIPSSSPRSDAPTVITDITIKTSTHKSLTAFLKVAEKASLLTLKPPQKNQPDVLVTSVNGSHPSVVDHASFVTVKDIETTAVKKAAREEKERESQAHKDIEIRELYKPHQTSIELFEGMGASKSDLYTIPEIRSLVNNYITSHNLVNAREQAYINLDELLYSCVSVKQKAKSKSKESESETPQFMKRDELTKKIIAKMQSWYEIRPDGRDPVTKKGTLTPVQVVMKVRQGRKASTLITGFEPFFVDAEEMAEDLRKACAGSTSVSPIPGKPAGAGLEVLVQGKQSTAVVEYLTAKGIPKKWIEVADLSGKK